MRIRAENEQDFRAITAVIKSAFESPAEAKLVAALREQAQPFISLIAEKDEQIIGHIMFSPVVLGDYQELRIMGLAPLAVIPQYQRQGVGSALVRAGLEQCQRLGFGAVVVLGHPDYYPRFGFLPSRRFAVRSEYDVPEEAFMLQELTPSYLKGTQGTIRYHAAFNNL